MNKKPGGSRRGEKGMYSNKGNSWKERSKSKIDFAPKSRAAKRKNDRTIRERVERWECKREMIAYEVILRGGRGPRKGGSQTRAVEKRQGGSWGVRAG